MNWVRYCEGKFIVMGGYNFPEHSISPTQAMRSKLVSILSSVNMSAFFKGGKYLLILYCVKSVRIRSYSGPHFPVFGLNNIQSKCGKIRTRITPNTVNFHAVLKYFAMRSGWDNISC